MFGDFPAIAPLPRRCLAVASLLHRRLRRCLSAEVIVTLPTQQPLVTPAVSGSVYICNSLISGPLLLIYVI